MVTEPETTFGYAVVEKALMAVHGFVEQKRGAFRARLIHFQRLKVVPAAPGRAGVSPIDGKTFFAGRSPWSSRSLESIRPK